MWFLSMQLVIKAEQFFHALNKTWVLWYNTEQHTLPCNLSALRPYQKKLSPWEGVL